MADKKKGKGKDKAKGYKRVKESHELFSGGTSLDEISEGVSSFFKGLKPKTLDEQIEEKKKQGAAMRKADKCKKCKESGSKNCDC